MKLLSAILLLAVSALAQTQPPPPASQPAQPPAKKAKHVWTNDDIQDAGGRVSVVGDSKKSDTPSEKKSDQSAETKEEPCASDPWLVALLGVLQTQGVPANARYWNDRAFGGLCKPATLSSLAKAADGHHVFDDGTKFRIKATASDTWPQGTAIVAAANDNQPFIVSYQGEPYVTTFVDYIDHSYSNGSHVYVVSKVQMTQPITGHVVIFDVKQPIKIDGTLVAQVEK